MGFEKIKPLSNNGQEVIHNKEGHGSGLKKVLKNITIGAMLLAKVAGGSGVAESKEISDLDSFFAKGKTNYSTSVNKNKTTISPNNITNSVQVDMSGQGEQKEGIKYVQKEDYSKPFNILSEQENKQFTEKGTSKQIFNEIINAGLKEFVKTRKLGDREKYIDQIVYKYGAGAVSDLLQKSYLGLDEFGEKKRTQNVDEKMKILRLHIGFVDKGEPLKRTMYNLASNLEDGGKLFDKLIEKIEQLNFSRAITPATFSQTEIKFLIENPEELEAYIQLSQQYKTSDAEKFVKEFGKDYLKKPIWEIPPSTKLSLLKN